MQDDLRMDLRERTVRSMQGPQHRTAPLDADTLGSVLRALAVMARGSQRRQADIQFALRRASISIPADVQAAALDQLRAAGLITQLIPLGDGGLLLTVTQSGMMRAGLSG